MKKAKYRNKSSAPNSILLFGSVSLVVVLIHFIQYEYAGVDVSKVEGTSIREFTDYDSISSWALTLVQWTINNGIVSGSGVGAFAPIG